ncbi:23252_t:CDS:1, partial [Gigaspora margarita]
FEIFQSAPATQPETLFGSMIQVRNKYIRHPIQLVEMKYFFDRNSEAYIIAFYQNGKLK